MARRISFWATKKIKKPTVVRFRRSDGTIANFKATKVIKKPVKVTFYSTGRKRRRWKNIIRFIWILTLLEI